MEKKNSKQNKENEPRWCKEKCGGQIWQLCSLCADAGIEIRKASRVTTITRFLCATFVGVLFLLVESLPSKKHLLC